MHLKVIFHEQGGLKLLKQYWKSGAFFTAIAQFLLLGKSKTALEILKLSTSLKTKQKLEEQYKKKLIRFENDWKENLPHERSNKVWVCWFQGMEQAPKLVQQCYKSLKENMSDKEIILITFKNIFEYVEFPEYVIKKWREKKITHTHMTDLLRLELLTKYGGMWIDSTVFCTEKDIPNYMVDSDLFFFQCLKPGRVGHTRIISSWLISAKSNNKILTAVKELCYEYWKENDSLWDYFLLHDFFTIVLEKYPEEWSKVVPKDNAAPHILLLRLFDKYDEQIWNAIESQTPFHKLTYKFSDKQTEIRNTYYDVLIRNERINI